MRRFVELGTAQWHATQDYQHAMRLAVRAILTSPQFLFLREQPGPLDDYALASRLSYFLWGTMPDDTLMQLAREGRLSEPAVLSQQTDRLVDDPRSEAFVASFVDQWLDLQRINATTPDAKLYPEYDEVLRLSMLQETHAFFRELLIRDLPLHNVIDSDFAMLNRRLAEHYGINAVAGQQMRRVELPADSHRGGVLTQASVLKVTANGTVTSPVVRGAFVLTRLLDAPPPPPPPGAGAIEPDTRGATTVREQLAMHRSNHSCGSCHAAIDPPGFALESFDVIGGWRSRYRSAGNGFRVEKKLRGRSIWEYRLGPQVDPSGEMLSGERFEDIDGFKRILLERRDQVARCVISKLIVYATGHPIELADREVVEAILESTATSGHGLRSVVHHIVQSPLFQSK